MASVQTFTVTFTLTFYAKFDSTNVHCPCTTHCNNYTASYTRGTSTIKFVQTNLALNVRVKVNLVKTLQACGQHHNAVHTGRQLY